MKIRSLILAASALSLGACETLQEDIAETTADTYRAWLTGANEVGGGDPDGFGEAEITVSDILGQVCWDLNNIQNIGPITAAHVHFGAAGTDGPPVFTLRPTDNGNYKGCASGSEWTQDQIEDNPQEFYVNVHTSEYPAGAIRGQLTN